MKPTLIIAALNLVPGAQISCDGSNIVWHEYTEPPVTDEKVNEELQRLLLEYDSKKYQRLRAAAYPPVADYLDGVVKGDQAQIDKYVADCLAVKAKYPKPAS